MSNFESENQDSSIYIDVGNSSIKIGVFQNDKWKVNSTKEVEEAIVLINKYEQPVSRIFLCSVRKELSEAFSKQVGDRTLKQVMISDIPARNLDYDTPETLGIDRYLACSGAYSIANKGVVVIDAGSACTIDYMDANGVFQGGVIMPGLKSILSIFKEAAPELPEIKVGIPANFPGKSTKESLQWGQVGFFVDGIISVINAYDEKVEDYNLYLTGGDAPVLYELLGHIGEVHPNLVLTGLREMEYTS